jgi:hypothetical protein
MRIRALTTALLLALSTGAASGAPLTPLIWGWEQFFTIEWQPETRNGLAEVGGYVRNDWGMAAANVRLLVESLGPNSEVTGQRVAWLGSMLTPGTSAYFLVPAPRGGSAYRVSVFAFDWVQMGGGDHR